MKQALLFLSIFLPGMLAAQLPTGTPYTQSPFFAQVGVGALPVGQFFNLELSGAAGLRFNEYLAAGAELKFTLKSTEQHSWQTAGVGLLVRGQTPRGWYATLSGGPLLTGRYTSNTATTYAYESGGAYGATELGYQSRRGFTLGVYCNLTTPMNFQELRYDEGLETYVAGDRMSEGFTGFGVKMGYAFPARR